MTQPSLPFGDPVARRTDPDTSWDAARSVDLRRRTRTHSEILAILAAHGPLMDHEIAAHAITRGSFTSPSGFRTRRKELTARGFVVFTGRYGHTPAGRRAEIWGLP